VYQASNNPKNRLRCKKAAVSQANWLQSHGNPEEAQKYRTVIEQMKTQQPLKNVPISVKQSYWEKEYIKNGRPIIKKEAVAPVVKNYNKNHHTSFRIFGGLARKGVSDDIDVITNKPLSNKEAYEIAQHLHKEFGCKVDVFYKPDQEYRNQMNKDLASEIKQARREVHDYKNEEDRWNQVKMLLHEITIESDNEWHIDKKGQLVVPDYMIESAGGGFAFSSGFAFKKHMQKLKREKSAKEIKQLSESII